MLTKLAVLAVMLVTLLGMAAPALAQEQDEVPACVLANACGDKPGEHQYEPKGAAFSATSAPEFDVTPEAGNNHSQYGIPQGCSDDCAERVAQATEEAITGDGTDNGTGSEAGTDPADAFSAAIDATLSPGGSPGSGDAAASEQTPIPVQGNEAVAYRAASEAAKESGLDDEAATKAAGVAVAEASKTRKGGSPSEGIDGVRYVLWDATGWHREYPPPAWTNRAPEQQKREGWEMAVRIEKIIATVLDEAHERQVEEVMETLSEGPEGFYG